jgi:hypothetical protein
MGNRLPPAVVNRRLLDALQRIARQDDPTIRKITREGLIEIARDALRRADLDEESSDG